MTKQSENDDHVKLKPVLGIRPGVYLTVLYSFVLLVILFFLLFFPGLREAGAVLTVKTEPAGAAIRVDGVYMGVSGNEIFVTKGTRNIEAVMPGFESQNAVHQIPGCVFASLFFPTRYSINFTLKTADPSGAFARYAADFAEWSFGGEPTAARQMPLSLSEGAYRTGEANGPAVQEILLAASRFASTRGALRDLIRAKVLLDNYGAAPSPSSLLGSISDLTAFLSDNPGCAEWLADLLPREASASIKSSAWYKNDLTAPPLPLPSRDQIPGRPVIAGLTFTLLPAPYSLLPAPIYISENPVPRNLFETFLNENPEWNEHKTDFYPEQLSVYPQDTFGIETITGVTWYAAEAFCKWLTGRLPASMADMEVRLPLENEWEHAANSGFVSMKEPGWEWCADPFAPLNFIAAPARAVQAVGSPERSLRRSPSSSSEEERSSLPPEFSSPYVSFRPVIAQREN